jgi:hypothetical protein
VNPSAAVYCTSSSPWLTAKVHQGFRGELPPMQVGRQPSSCMLIETYLIASFTISGYCMGTEASRAWLTSSARCPMYCLKSNLGAPFCPFAARPPPACCCCCCCSASSTSAAARACVSLTEIQSDPDQAPLHNATLAQRATSGLVRRHVASRRHRVASDLPPSDEYPVLSVPVCYPALLSAHCEHLLTCKHRCEPALSRCR